jgi:DNA-binding SARP family transcriptional activator
LRYLVTRPNHRAVRDVLLDLFWPGEESDRATHKLHIAVSKLRATLQAGISLLLSDPLPPSQTDALNNGIVFENDGYQLHASLIVETDADAFAGHVRAGELLDQQGQHREAVQEYRAAVDLYQGDFLVEDLYADWAVASRARLEETYLTVLGHLADEYLAQGEYAESITCCRQILARDSFREDAYRQLMRCYSRLGRRNQALREFVTCEQILSQELGVPPMKETIDLRDQIVREEDV